MQQPAWKHAEVFPIIARLIGEAYRQHTRDITEHEIAVRLLMDGEARAMIEAAQQQQHASSPDKVAINMVAWFSARFTIGDSEYQWNFERTKIKNRWAYKPTQTAG
jgi:hypothetical protein